MRLVGSEKNFSRNRIRLDGYLHNIVAVQRAAQFHRARTTASLQTAGRYLGNLGSSGILGAELADIFVDVGHRNFAEIDVLARHDPLVRLVAVQNIRVAPVWIFDIQLSIRVVECVRLVVSFSGRELRRLLAGRRRRRFLVGDGRLTLLLASEISSATSSSSSSCRRSIRSRSCETSAFACFFSSSATSLASFCSSARTGALFALVLGSRCTSLRNDPGISLSSPVVSALILAARALTTSVTASLSNVANVFGMVAAFPCESSSSSSRAVVAASAFDSNAATSAPIVFAVCSASAGALSTDSRMAVLAISISTGPSCCRAFAVSSVTRSLSSPMLCSSFTKLTPLAARRRPAYAARVARNCPMEG